MHEDLGIPSDYLHTTRLSRCPTPNQLVSIGQDIYGRDQTMTPESALNWQDMVDRAQEDGIELLIVSAFRSPQYQCEVIRRSLDQGDTIEDILTRVAAPGFSEHHTGRAVDLTSPGFEAVEETFEQSDAFGWLCENASRFRFNLSYPRDNPFGVIYEPWHWCYQE